MKVKNLHVYRIAPMDFGWNKLLTVDDYVQIIVRDDRDERLENDETVFGTGVVLFYSFLHRAFDAAKKVGWDGDFADGPYVGFLPSSHETKIFVAWKQRHDGCTFVASTVELTYLENHQ